MCSIISASSLLAAALAAALPTLTLPLAPPLDPAHAPPLVRQSLSVGTPTRVATVSRSGFQLRLVPPAVAIMYTQGRPGPFFFGLNRTKIIITFLTFHSP